MTVGCQVRRSADGWPVAPRQGPGDRAGACCSAAGSVDRTCACAARFERSSGARDAGAAGSDKALTFFSRYADVVELVDTLA